MKAITYADDGAGAHDHDCPRPPGAGAVLHGEGPADRIRESAPEGIDAGLDSGRTARGPGRVPPAGCGAGSS
ncbi:hypothetical protein [Streptomyces sp. A1136]|uniref:hypothetical protein n=1 Tax=Streptomyces sp. A1136 TaxID=2563102 RepID=UPI0019CFF4C2|nr:hypothetical protein [Streptomyces sp. A1136]